MIEKQEQRIIRHASPQEAKELSTLALRSKAAWGYSPEFIEACRQELSVSPAFIETNLTYVIECAGEIHGFYSLVKISGNDVELDSLFVEPERIGSGCGRELVEHAMVEARRRGYHRVIIQSDPNAERFYRAAGARLTGERESGSIPGRMLPVMEITL